MQVVRRIKNILKTHYNIELKLEHDYYVVRHRDQFEQYLAKNADAAEFEFKTMKYDPQ